MMTVRATGDGPALTFNASIKGLPIYLDHDSLIDMAKGDPERRTRFLAALYGGADLMFSVTNAIELAGPQGRSIEIMREFLDQVGPHWFPVELDAYMVVHREGKGMLSPEVCLSKQFANDFFNFVTRPSVYAPGSGKVILCGA